jgi:hypothetical protein
MEQGPGLVEQGMTSGRMAAILFHHAYDVAFLAVV